MTFFYAMLVRALQPQKCRLIRTGGGSKRGHSDSELSESILLRHTDIRKTNAGSAFGADKRTGLIAFYCFRAASVLSKAGEPGKLG